MKKISYVTKKITTILILITFFCTMSIDSMIAFAKSGSLYISTQTTDATTVYTGPSSSVYVKVGSVDWHENVKVLGYDSGWFFIEYYVGNPSNNVRKRGFIPASYISGSPAVPSMSYGPNPGYSRSGQDVYAGPDYNYSKIGSVDDNEGVRILTSENGFSYIEYETDSGLKRGYVKNSPTALGTLNIPDLSVNGATYEKYGTSGRGRSLGAYKIGNGPKTIIMTFEVHGFEDAWRRDGEELVKIADRVINDMASYSNNNGGLNGWTAYIVRSVNPDGLCDGFTNNGPGRCTINDRVDINRSFPVDYTDYTTGRNNTGGRSLSVPEAKSLYDFIKAKNPDVVIDMHGWENGTLGNSEIGKYFDDQFGFGHNNHFQQGSVTDWAKTLKGGNTKSTLVELPWPQSSQDIANRKYAEKVSNATLNIIKKDAPPARLVIDSPSDNQNVDSDFMVSGWAVNQSGIKELKICVDGKYYTSLNVNEARPDVAKQYPQYKNVATCGYEGKIRVNDLSDGTHSIGVGAIGYDGVELNYSRTVIVKKKLEAKMDLELPSENQTFNNKVDIKGWALNQSGINKVQILVDGQEVGNATIGLTREDVKKDYPNYPNADKSGFTYSLDASNLKDGKHTIEASVIGNDGVVIKQSKTVNISQHPSRMNLDAPINNQTFTNTNKIDVGGWALNESGISKIQVLVDGQEVGNATIGLTRADVKKAYPNYTNADKSGFTYSLDASKLKDGKHTIEVRAIGNDSIVISQTKTVNVSHYPPRMSLDTPINNQTFTNANKIDVGGWALNESGINKIQVLVDGQEVGNATTGLTRADVKKVYPDYLNSDKSGFIYSMNASDLKEGQHTVQVRVIGNDGAVTTQSKTVNISQNPPRINVDSPVNGQVLNDNIDIRGWALNSSGVKNIVINIDGQDVADAINLGKTKVTVGKSRKDVCNVFPNYKNSNSGFEYIMPISTLSNGTHKIKVTAIGNDNSFIEQVKTITVNK